MDGLGAAISPLAMEVDSVRAINQIIERMMTIWDLTTTKTSESVMHPESDDDERPKDT